MKKIIISCLFAVMLLMAAACGKKTAGPAPAAQQLANPWVDCSLNDIQQKTGLDFGTPAGAANVTYRMMESEKLGEMNFTLENGASCCARVKAAGQSEDISGMNYTWASTAKVDSEVNGSSRSYTISKTGDGKVLLCSWFDAVPGIQWTLSVSGDKDLGELDIVSLADQTFVTMQGEA